MYHLWIADNCSPQKEIHFLLWNCSFFTVFTTMCHQSLSSVIHSALSHYISLNFTLNIIILYLGLHTFRFTDYNSVCITHTSCVCYIYPAHLILLDLVPSVTCTCSGQHKSWSSSLCYCATFFSLSPLYDQISSSALCSEAPSLWCFAQCDKPSFTLVPTDIMLQTQQQTFGFHKIHIYSSLLFVQLSAFHRLHHRLPYLVTYMQTTTRSPTCLAAQHPLLHPITLPLLHLQAPS